MAKPTKGKNIINRNITASKGENCIHKSENDKAVRLKKMHTWVPRRVLFISKTSQSPKFNLPYILLLAFHSTTEIYKNIEYKFFPYTITTYMDLAQILGLLITS